MRRSFRTRSAGPSGSPGLHPGLECVAPLGRGRSAGGLSSPRSARRAPRTKRAAPSVPSQPISLPASQPQHLPASPPPSLPASQPRSLPASQPHRLPASPLAPWAHRLLGHRVPPGRRRSQGLANGALAEAARSVTSRGPDFPNSPAGARCGVPSERVRLGLPDPRGCTPGWNALPLWGAAGAQVA
jgi:hypothetical protein